MRLSSQQLDLSATDLASFLACRHRTALDLAAAAGKLRRPHWDDPLLDLLIERGKAHEKRYVDSLRATGATVVDLNAATDRDKAVSGTLDAMRAGADVIVQAALQDGHWYGRPDILRRVDVPSDLGKWSYEVADTKLARETKAGTILQLGLYSEMLAKAQGRTPEYFFVVTPDPVAPEQRYRVNDYAAYFRFVRARMEETVAQNWEAIADANYPEPVAHCEVCAWARRCDEKRHADDHLSLVAGISRVQRRELESRNVGTLTGLAELAVPLPFKPKRGSPESYVRAREQARVQLASRGVARPLHELREIVPEQGLCRLPKPSPGDIFLDLEGDPFAGDGPGTGGREYLFGVVTLGDDGHPSYRSFWAFTEREEREAFEAVMDLIARAWQRHESMHVYHYAPYEPSAFKRLMGRYATREQELDRMLRAERFVDLYAVVRQSMFAGVESYSIKKLEPMYVPSFERDVPLDEAGRSLRAMEQALWLNCTDTLPGDVRDAVEGYNQDDCVSTLRLRDWLESLRARAIESGAEIPRPVPQQGAPPEAVDERAQRVAALRTRLLDGVAEAAADRTGEQHARWLLAYLLDYHRREDKAGWWEYYRLKELPEEDLFDEPHALAGLEYVERAEVVKNKKTGRPTGSVVDRYRFPPQEMELGPGAELKLEDGNPFGKLVDLDRLARTVDIRKGPGRAEVHPAALFGHTHVPSAAMEESLMRLGLACADRGIESTAAAADLLLRRSPRLRSAPFAPNPSETAQDFAVRIVADLDRTVLAIQGPPGAGKTFTGARMICALVRQGKKVGVTANSHSVIVNLLECVAEQAKKDGLDVRLARKGEEEEDAGAAAAAAPIAVIADNAAARDAIRSGAAHVLGATAWAWSRPEFTGAVDVLFVDEAGQMSLANVLAVAQAADSIVLLGDPQQLEQPRKGSHPEGVGVAALQHILGDLETIPSERGIFLPVTWRLAPSICAFTSELFYEGRLAAKPGLERQVLLGGALAGSGLRLVEVEHQGNRNASPEEVDVVARLVEQLTAPGVRWVNAQGEERQMTPADVLVVSPYNAQVSRLAERLAESGARVGTVDKFQGQEAPVVIYSMATSLPEDAPRGMEFLYSLNRLNVATSRARCLGVLVASPRLLEPECKTPRQIKLANALCRFREAAQPWTPSAIA
jgi:predicted RecB family nuclease